MDYYDIFKSQILSGAASRFGGERRAKAGITGAKGPPSTFVSKSTEPVKHVTKSVGDVTSQLKQYLSKSKYKSKIEQAIDEAGRSKKSSEVNYKPSGAKKKQVRNRTKPKRKRKPKHKQME